MDIEAYSSSLAALGAMGVLMFLQMLAADIVGILRKQVPGAPVTADHADMLFRVTRTVGNTNESIAIFIIGLMLCVHSGASAAWTAYAAWAYVATRAIYAVCYYTNQQTLRSISFGLSFVALATLLIVGFFTGLGGN
ncbi:MAG: MAPEG family protein [Pseudomonadota bacterium]